VLSIPGVESTQDRSEALAPRGAGAVAHPGSPLEARGADRSRLDMAFATARRSLEQRAGGGIPGLRSELFPAATWRTQLEQLAGSMADEADDRARKEEARLAYLLSHPRAEDILHTARKQAQRLVSAAGAVAKARRDQAEREASGALAEARRVAEATVAAARRQAEEMAVGHSGEMAQLNERLLRLRSSLQDAEAKLGAYSSHTRRASSTEPGVIDLDEEQEKGDLEALVEDEIAEAEIVEDEIIEDEAPVAVVHAPHPASRPVDSHDDENPPSAPRLRPKGRFTVPGLTPDRIEALRDELTP
jgi:hypothetical protein